MWILKYHQHAEKICTGPIFSFLEKQISKSCLISGKNTQTYCYFKNVSWNWKLTIHKIKYLIYIFFLKNRLLKYFFVSLSIKILRANHWSDRVLVYKIAFQRSVKVYNYFGEGYHQPPKRNRPWKKITLLTTKNSQMYS